MGAHTSLRRDPRRSTRSPKEKISKEEYGHAPEEKGPKEEYTRAMPKNKGPEDKYVCRHVRAPR